MDGFAIAPVLGCVVDLALVGSRGASAAVEGPCWPAAGCVGPVLALRFGSCRFIEGMSDILEVFPVESFFSAVASLCVSWCN